MVGVGSTWSVVRIWQSGLHMFWRRPDKPIDQHQARRGCGCIGQGKQLHNDGGQVELIVFTCLWHLNIPYWSHDLPQVTNFGIQGEILISSVFCTTYIKSCKTIPMVSLFQMGISLHPLDQITWSKDSFVAKSWYFTCFHKDYVWFPHTQVLYCVHYKSTKHWNGFASHCMLSG